MFYYVPSYSVQRRLCLRKGRIFLLLIVIAAISIFLFKTGSKQQQTEPLTVIDEMFTLISEQSVYETKPEQLIEGALEGMVKALNDPYSNYYTEQEAALHHEQLAKERVGIGIELSQSHGKFIVVSPVKNSPAERAGIRPLDEILEVDNTPVTGKTMANVQQLMHGKAGEEVALTLYRPQLEQHMKVVVKREKLTNDTVTFDFLQKDEAVIGYITISLFAQNTAEQWIQALQQMQQKKPAAILIDVRDNPGGYLHAVAQLMTTFDNSGKVFAFMQNEKGEATPLKTENIKELEPFIKFLQSVPIAVLQNEGSASASELFTSALTDWKRATIIGTTSFGKGTVQETWKLQNKGEVKLSTNRWLSSKQQWFHGKGVKPHIEVTQHSLFAMKLLAFEGSFEQGDLHEAISHVQTILHELGYTVSRQDGYFDEETALAMQLFRAHYNLPNDPKLDERLFEEVQRQLLVFKENRENDTQLQMALDFLAHELTN